MSRSDMFYHRFRDLMVKLGRSKHNEKHSLRPDGLDLPVD